MTSYYVTSYGKCVEYIKLIFIVEFISFIFTFIFLFYIIHKYVPTCACVCVYARAYVRACMCAINRIQEQVRSTQRKRCDEQFMSQ